MPTTESLLYAILGVVLIVNTITDIRRLEVHDPSLLVGGLFCLILRMYTPDLLPGLAIGAAFGFLTGLALFLGGMGFGDVKLLALIGGCLGVGGCVVTLAVAGVAASLYGLIYLRLVRKKSLKTELPFVPFLALGTAAAFLLQHFWEGFL